MEYPMKIYGLNLFERFLTDFLAFLGWLLVIFAVVIGIFLKTFLTNELIAGVLITGTAATGVMLLLGSTGIRQNRAAVDMGYFFLALISLGWLISGLFMLKIGSLVAGIIMVLLFVFILFLRRQAIQARFKPRYFSLRKFETMIQIADTMLDADGKEALHPIEVAINVDHLMDIIDSSAREDIDTVLVLTEWLLPLLIWRPIPFSDMGSIERRRAVEKVIGAKGVFRDVARALKMLACVGYYGSPKGMAQVGYIPFEERERSQGVDQTPQQYPDPFLIGGAK